MSRTCIRGLALAAWPVVFSACGGAPPGDDATSSGATANRAAAITALGPATLAGCTATQRFLVTSPAVIAWIHTESAGLAGLDLGLYAVASSGALTRLDVAATQASALVAHAEDDASDSEASRALASLAWDQAASRATSTVARSSSGASSGETDTGHLSSSTTQTIHTHHDGTTTDTHQSGFDQKVSGSSVANDAVVTAGATSDVGASSGLGTTQSGSAQQAAGAQGRATQFGAATQVSGNRGVYLPNPHS